MVSHPPKTKGAPAVHKVSGSVAFIAAARSGFLIIRDPEEEDRRLMVPIKNNLGSDKNGLSFRIKKILLESGIETSKLEVGSRTNFRISRFLFESGEKL